MRINSNSTAMTALNDLDQSPVAAPQNADDVLKPSEVYTARPGSDKAGIPQTLQSSQDAITSSKAADVGLLKIQSLLGNLTTLVGSGKTGPSVQRQAESVLQAIDHVVAETQIADKSLLDGSPGNLLSGSSTSQLGTETLPGKSLATINLNSKVGASQAVAIVRNADEQVSAQREQLGSFRSNALNTANENLAASQASPLDADAASRLTQLTRQQLLEQPQMAALAQGNQNSQSVLQALSAL